MVYSDTQSRKLPRCFQPPPNWEYSKAPWYLGLVVKIFRRDPQLALDVADVMTDLSNVPLSRAERRKQQDAVRRSEKKRLAVLIH